MAPRSPLAPCVALALAVGGAAGEVAARRMQWSTPTQLLGGCNTVWTSAFAKYILPYAVEFEPHGTFKWWAPYRNGLATELGHGKFLSEPVWSAREDGSWEAHYWGANRFLPDPNNATNCCCEYVGGSSVGGAEILADYIVAVVPNTHGRPMEDVCAPFEIRCPRDNATALQELGQPFIEVYQTCGAARYGEATLAAAALLAILGAVCLACRVFRRARVSPEGDICRTLSADLKVEEALRRHLREKLMVPDGGSPECREASGRSTPSTTASGLGCSPLPSDASWSRSVSRRFVEDLPAPGWSRAATEQAFAATSVAVAARQLTS